MPGVRGGEAVAELLSGRSSPSGALPLTWEKFGDGAGRHDGKVNDLCTEGQGQDRVVGDGFPFYQYVSCDVQFQFGEGMTYTDFLYEVDESSGVSGVLEEGGAGMVRECESASDSLRSSLTSSSLSQNFTVTVRNVGARSGRGISLMFYQTLWREGETPAKSELFGFQKTRELAPGEEEVVVHQLKVRSGDERSGEERSDDAA